ncbi:hypothetical protein E2C01_069301 [Portunus trituberculatus]|uniref:Peptidase A2 domain-containing protein n=1 Tax=Portunus trituberculatus TaxID=210409 RepID=A0A5B7HPQ1_PORTR|nr:hypothetical protein [Portunus trituberculatus]
MCALLRGLQWGWTPLQRLPQPEGGSVSGKRLQAEDRGRLSAGQNSSALVCVKCHYTVGSAQVRGAVDGRPCRTTVDSGADHTLVRPGLVEAEWLPDLPQQLCGVMRDCMSLQVPVNARVRVGGVEEDMPVFVTDLDEECLLGYDYLTRMDACLDFRQKRKTVCGHEMPFLREVRRAEVVTTKQHRLHPHTEARVQCCLTCVVKEAEGLVEPVSDLRLADSVALGRSLIEVGEELVTVLLANFSDKA